MLTHLAQHSGPPRAHCRRCKGLELSLHPSEKLSLGLLACPHRRILQGDLRQAPLPAAAELLELTHPMDLPEALPLMVHHRCRCSLTWPLPARQPFTSQPKLCRSLAGPQWQTRLLSVRLMGLEPGSERALQLPALDLTCQRDMLQPLQNLVQKVAQKPLQEVRVSRL